MSMRSDERRAGLACAALARRDGRGGVGVVLSTQNELVFAIGNGATASGVGAYGDGTIRLRQRVAAESRRSVAGARAPAPAASELSPEADGPLPKAEELSPVADGARPTANALFAEANKSRPMAREAPPIAMALFTANGLSAVPLPALMRSEEHT